MNARRIGLLLCLLVSTAAAATVWIFPRVSYTATVLFRVAREKPWILPDDHTQSPPGAYEQFKATQRQIVLGDVVLNEVLRKPEVAHHPTILAEAVPLTWLREHIRVTFPEDSEIMSVSATTRDANQAGLLANAVSEAYLQLVASMEQSYSHHLGTTLQSELQKYKSALQLRRANLQHLLKQSGLSDEDTLLNREQFAQDTREVIHGELVHTQLEMSRLQATLDIKRTRYERLSEPDSKELASLVSELDLENAAGPDPLMCELRTRMGKMEEPVEDGVVEPAIDGAGTGLPAHATHENITKQMDARRAELRVTLQGQVLAKLRDELTQLGSELAIQEAFAKRLVENETEHRVETERPGNWRNWRMEIDEVKQEITALEDVGRRLHQAILEQQLSNDAPPRVLPVSLGAGSIPEMSVPRFYSRLWMSIGAALTAWLLVPLAVILLRFPRWIFSIAFPAAPDRQGVVVDAMPSPSA